MRSMYLWMENIYNKNEEVEEEGNQDCGEK